MEKISRIGKVILHHFFLLVTFTFISFAIASAAVYYVAPNGSDSNDGSMNNPWATIMHAVNNSGPGDIVYLRGGTYNEFVGIRGHEGRGGSNGNFWTLQSYPGEIATITNSIALYMASYVRIKGLRVENGTIYNSGWIVTGYSFPHHNEILNNTVIGPQQRYNMIGVIGDDNLVEGNTIIVTGGGDSLDHGIYVMSGSRNIIRNNFISGAKGFGIHIYDEVKQNRSGQIREVVIEGNTITSCGSGGIIVATGYSGIPLAKNIMIKNNIIYGHIGADYNEGIELRVHVEDIYIYNNTLYNNHDGIDIATCCSQTLDRHIDNVHIKNNIIDIGSSSGNHLDIRDRTIVSDLSIESNLYWPAPIKIRDDNPDITINDTFPITSDPKFANISNNDFHLLSSSAAIDKGITIVDVSKDKDGISRPQGCCYDIGAYEYVDIMRDTVPPAPPILK